jgi:tRNA A58 N-methylase Trm61
MSAAFNRAMVVATSEAAPALLAAYDFSRFTRIVDVGGGSGALMAAILRAHPGVRGVVFDMKAGVEGAAALLEEAGLADRCAIVGGDFLVDELPAEADAYVLKSVLDDLDDDRTVVLLQNCRRAIAANGRLVVITPLMPNRVEPSEPVRDVVMFDLQMLVSSGGRERTEPELASLFASAGFDLAAVIPTAARFPFSVVEGLPV